MRKLRTFLAASVLGLGLLSFASATDYGDGYFDAGTIADGESKTITVENNGDRAIVEFTAEESGTYSFYSSAAAYDTVGYFYDSEGESLASDDDSGIGGNFLITYNCEEGATYFIETGFYYSSSDERVGDFTLSVTQGTLYNAFVGDVIVTSDNCDDVLGDGTVSYDDETKTFTLSNATIDKSFEIWDMVAGIGAEFVGYSYYDTLYTIVLEGDNVINVCNGDQSSAGVYLDNLHLTGDGTLTINATDIREDYMSGIYSSKSVVIDADVTVNIDGYNAYSVVGIETNNEMTIADANVVVSIENAHYAAGLAAASFALTEDADVSITITCDDTNESFAPIEEGPRSLRDTEPVAGDVFRRYGVYAEYAVVAGKLIAKVTDGDFTYGMSAYTFTATGDSIVELIGESMASVVDTYNFDSHKFPNSVWVNTEPTAEGRTKWDGESDLRGTEEAAYRYLRLPAETVTVTFVDGNGNVILEEEVGYGEDAKAPENPTRDGYLFDGWDVEFDDVREALTVTAKWKEAPAPAPAESSSSNLDPAPKTGVNESPLAIAALAVLAAFGVALVYRKERE